MLRRSAVEVRGGELLAAGLSPLRAFRRLRSEFPWAENLDLHVAVGLGPTGVNPLWADHGSLRPVVVRYDPRKEES
jgi:hypothetical protein